MRYTVIITGGTRGLGLAVLEKFLAQGFDAAFCGTRAALVEETTARLKQLFPGSAVFGITADLSDPVQVKSFAAEALNLLGRCDVLVNNAGIFKPGGILTEPEGLYEELMSVNMNQVYHLTRALAPAVISSSRGHIFNMCSIASIKAYPDGGSYCISKFALYGFSQVLREELKPHGTAVTAVLPGATLTDSWAGSGLPPERFVRPSDVAELIYSAWTINENGCTEEILIRPKLGDI